MECKGKENIIIKAAYFNYLLPCLPDENIKKMLKSFPLPKMNFGKHP